MENQLHEAPLCLCQDRRSHGARSFNNYACSISQRRMIKIDSIFFPSTMYEIPNCFLERDTQATRIELPESPHTFDYFYMPRSSSPPLPDHFQVRSKKYVKLNNGERVTASGKIKTDSGTKMKANKTGIYKRWKEQSHKKVSLKGTNDGSVEGASTSAGNPGFRGDYRRFQGRHNLKSIQNAHIRSEIKNIEQVRKERQKKADRLSYLKGKPKKAKKKFGGKEKKGKAK